MNSESTVRLGTCFGKVQKQPLSGKILYIPEKPCEIKTKIIITRNLGIEQPMGVYNNCQCNEIAALTNRHLKPPLFDHPNWEEASRMTEKYYTTFVDLVSMKQIVNRYVGTKKRLYNKAYEQYRTFGFQQKYAYVKMFIKTERFKEEHLGIKPPRAIQYRHPIFNLQVLRFINPFEEHYYQHLSYGNCTQTRVIMKGLNWVKRAKIFVEKAQSFLQPKFICLDFSRFDSTITVDHLKSTHRKYYKVGGRPLRHYFRMQLKNKCWTRSGIKYVVDGTRMSGDADTGLGNTIINLDAIHYVLYKSNITKYDMIVDGDDAVVIIEQGEFYNLDIYKTLGFEVKADITKDIFRVDFCQSRLVLTPEPVFVRNPIKVLSTVTTCYKDYLRSLDRWTAAVGLCEEAVNPGVPILSVLGSSLAKLSNRPLFDKDMRRRMMGMKQQHAPITDIGRLTFYYAWGINPSMQEFIEDMLTGKLQNLLNENINILQNVEQLQRQRTWDQLRYEFGGSGWWYSS